MSADWGMGDKALCIDARDYPETAKIGRGKLVESRIYTVCKIRKGARTGRLILGLAEFPGEDGKHFCYLATRFRKIRPDEHTQCEPEFVQLLKRSRKRVSA